MIEGIHHASFTVSNLERSIAFYRDILGMEVLWDSVEARVKYKGEVSDRITGCPGTEQHLVYLGIGEDFLELVEYTPGGKSLVNNMASDIGAAHVCFKTDDIHRRGNQFQNEPIAFDDDVQAAFAVDVGVMATHVVGGNSTQGHCRQEAGNVSVQRYTTTHGFLL